LKLDNRAVAALSLGAKTDLITFDDQLPGFGYRLRAGAGGKVLRSWIAQYRHHGRTRRLLLGSADVLSAEQARTQAKKVLAEATLGNDPQGERSDRRDRDAVTLRSVVTEYLAVKETAVRPATHRMMRAYLRDGDYFKPLHALPVDKIERRDIAAQLLAIARRRSKTTAAMARSSLAAFFTWAMQQGLVQANPTIGTEKTTAPERDRVLSNPELAAIWNAAGDPTLGDFGKIVRLLILMPARRQEIGGIAFSEIDRERGTWTLPVARSKNHRAHTLPLLGMALDIISSVPQRAGRDRLFGERGPLGFTAWDRFKRQLDEKSGVTDWKLHDIRRTVATRLADIGIQPHVIEQILNHQSGHKRGPAGIYNRSSYEREVRTALARWEEHLRTLVGGGERKVVSLSTGSTG
jgi:integrase